MRFYPTKIYPKFLCFVFLALLALISCSKDSDLLRDAILSDSVISVEEIGDEVALPEEPVIEEELPETLESRTTSFVAINDAHFQSGKGYDQNIIRLEEGNRTSYLMFDLSAIEAIEGEITAASLEFTISSDDGNGNIAVYQGISNNWSEENLAESSIPETGEELGSITKDYKIGATEKIVLSSTKLLTEVNTLILDHKGGNDLAFASKEHASKEGPTLVVTYSVPLGADEIVPVKEEETTTTENKEPMAIADGTPTTGKAPLEVTFTGSNSSDDVGIESYSWNFKDGATSTQTNPKHTFTEIGTYEVELTVVDDQGLENTDTVFINVTNEENTPPVAVISADPTSGAAPLAVKFDGSKSTDDNGISSFVWNFKDGSESNNPSPTHTFTEAGTYEVELTIKDENGLTVKKDITITVAPPANQKPVAVVAANRTSGEAPLTVQFTGSNSTDDTKVENYSWNFKDGSTSTNSNPSHTFNSPGTYNVSLVVTDAEGLSDTKSISIRVTEPSVTNSAPKAIGTPSRTSGQAPLEVSFTGDKSTDDDGIASYAWNFDDGSAVSTQANATHTFQEAGTYRVSLTVTDADGATNTDVDTITVTAPSNNDGNTGGGSNGNYPNGVKASTFGFQAGDATEAFQDAINSNHSVIIIDKQSSDWIIKPTRFFDTTNKTIIFESGVVVRAKAGAFADKHAILIDLFRANNVTIEGYGATLKMNRNEYATSEFRHALKIYDSQNITVKGLTIRESGGDGININGKHTGYSSNITLEDIVSTNNRRQAMSIISAKDVWVRNSTFKDTYGQNPQAGVDLEPDSPTQRLQNINFINCRFTGNNNAGFKLAPHLLTQNSTPLSIKLNNCFFSNNGKSNSLDRPKAEIYLFSDISGNNVVKGNIEFNNCTIDGSQGRILFSQKPAEGYYATFNNCVAKNVVQAVSSAPIFLEGQAVAPTLGGFSFNNFRIEYSRNEAFMRIMSPPSTRLKNVQGTFVIKEPYDNEIDHNQNGNPDNGINVNINYTHIN